MEQGAAGCDSVTRQRTHDQAEGERPAWVSLQIPQPQILSLTWKQIPVSEQSPAPLCHVSVREIKMPEDHVLVSLQHLKVCNYIFNITQSQA